MGLFNWLSRRFGLVRMIVDNAYNQYNKVFYYNNDMSEKEISNLLFYNRYLRQSAVLDIKGKNKLEKYISSGFEIESILDFCLINLDIEGNISPSDYSAYDEVAKIIMEELIKLGFNTSQEQIDKFSSKWHKKSFY